MNDEARKALKENTKESVKESVKNSIDQLSDDELDQVAGGGLFDELKQIGKSVWKDPGSM